MAKISQLTVSAARKVSASYNTRDMSLSVTLDLDETDDPKMLAQTWTDRLQFLVDHSIGDRGQPASFAATRNPWPESGKLPASKPEGNIQ